MKYFCGVDTFQVEFKIITSGPDGSERSVWSKLSGSDLYPKGRLVSYLKKEEVQKRNKKMDEMIN